MNEEAIGYLTGILWSKKAWNIIQGRQSEQDWEESEFVERMEDSLSNMSKQQRKMLLDAAAVAAYHAQNDKSVEEVLVCDDAPQSNWRGIAMMLCWVHEGKHYKKVMPVSALHCKLLDDFLKRF
ncbi:MAG: hypothetical protein HPY85_02445 [Anaerolineae bacterium]|nr:hypothetical protein [Anaerolineae bacterium]